MRDPGFTRADYEAMPDDWRGELIAGRLVMAPSPAPYHQHLLNALNLRICAHLGAEGAWRVLPAPLDVFIDETNVYQPDLLILPDGPERPHPDWEIPLPMWVVEILSPGTERYDRDIKVPRMAEAGLREAWLIVPRAREIEVHGLERGLREVLGMGDIARSRTLPGFALPLGDYFV